MHKWHADSASAAGRRPGQDAASANPQHRVASDTAGREDAASHRADSQDALRDISLRPVISSDVIEEPAPQRALGPDSDSAVIPRATYRLQLNSGFTFKDATALVPYLGALGISHIYCSPYFKARPGSVHGYD